MGTADWIVLAAIILVGVGLVWVEIKWMGNKLDRITDALKDDEYPDDHMPGRPKQ